MRTATFTLRYDVELPDFLNDADETEIVEYVCENWLELLQDYNFDCTRIGLIEVDQQRSGYNGRSFLDLKYSIDTHAGAMVGSGRHGEIRP